MWLHCNMKRLPRRPVIRRVAHLVGLTAPAFPRIDGLLFGTS